MNKKKAIFVFIFATLLAFIAVILIFSNSKKTDSQEKILQEESSIKQEIIKEEISQKEEIEQKEEVQTNINEQKVIQKPVTKSENKAVTAPVIKPLKIEEKTQEENINLQEENNDEKADAGILKEVNTNEIVITREFKSQAPAKYTFEGYGTIK